MKLFNCLSSSILVIFLTLFVSGCGGPSAPVETEVTHATNMNVYEAQRVLYNGPKVNVAVGDFKVKAAGAPRVIGDGLREMLVTALVNSNHFIVLDRQAIQDMMLEQDLSSSRRAAKGTGPKRGKIEGAEIYLYGVVSEFEADSGGAGISILSSAIPLSFGGGTKNSHMAIDLRAVDTATSRILFATRVAGEATDYNINIGTSIGGGSSKLPISLGQYSNTPMEKAIRVVIDKAVMEFVKKTPKRYYK